MRHNRRDEQTDRQANSDGDELLCHTEPLAVRRVDVRVGRLCGKAVLSATVPLFTPYIQNSLEQTAVRQTRRKLEKDTSDCDWEARSVGESTVDVSQGTDHKRTDR